MYFDINLHMFILIYANLISVLNETSIMYTKKVLYFYCKKKNL